MDHELKAPCHNRLVAGISCAILPVLLLSHCTSSPQLAYPAQVATATLWYAQDNPGVSDDEQDFKIKPAIQTLVPASETDSSFSRDTTLHNDIIGNLLLPAATALNIAEAFLPAPGQCRIWYLNKEAGEQPAADNRSCRKLQDNMPANAVLIYRPLVNSQFVEVCHFDPADRSRVTKVGFYHAATGELQREESF